MFERCLNGEGWNLWLRWQEEKFLTDVTSLHCLHGSYCWLLLCCQSITVEKGRKLTYPARCHISIIIGAHKYQWLWTDFILQYMWYPYILWCLSMCFCPVWNGYYIVPLLIKSCHSHYRYLSLLLLFYQKRQYLHTSPPTKHSELLVPVNHHDPTGFTDFWPANIGICWAPDWTRNKACVGHGSRLIFPKAISLLFFFSCLFLDWDFFFFWKILFYPKSLKKTAWWHHLTTQRG